MTPEEGEEIYNQGRKQGRIDLLNEIFEECKLIRDHSKGENITTDVLIYLWTLSREEV